MVDERWSPVVYGRLFKADQWWQAKPQGGLPIRLERAVAVTHCDGYGLEGRQRFLLAQDEEIRLVGVACAASELDADFANDVLGRKLYCFVGWAASVVSTLPPVPPLPHQRQNYATLAREVYRYHF